MKARELLLHIGHPKTGTTTLQFVLNEARDALRKQGVLFPDIYPHWGNAEIMGYLFFERQHVEWWRKGWLKEDYPESMATAMQCWDQIKQDVAATGPDTLIISSESSFDRRSLPQLQRPIRRSRPKQWRSFLISRLVSNRFGLSAA